MMQPHQGIPQTVAPEWNVYMGDGPDETRKSEMNSGMRVINTCKFIVLFICSPVFLKIHRDKKAMALLLDDILRMLVTWLLCLV